MGEPDANADIPDFLEYIDRVPGGEVVYSSMKYWTKSKSASENPC